MLSSLGLPLEYSGNFAVVYRVRCSETGTTRAVKCFTKEVVAHRRERYQAISRYLREARLPFFVDFEYQHRCLLVHGDWHPIVKMDWVEGLRLDAFLTVCFRKGSPKGMLQMLCRRWQKLAKQPRAANVAHGDLQHGNVLLVPVPGRDAYRLRLVDYDGMYVPALADLPPGEMGHAAYQHPQRLETGAYSPEIDRFSHLLIYTTLRSFMAGGDLNAAGARRDWTEFNYLLEQIRTPQLSVKHLRSLQEVVKRYPK